MTIFHPIVIAGVQGELCRTMGPLLTHSVS